MSRRISTVTLALAAILSAACSSSALVAPQPVSAGDGRSDGTVDDPAPASPGPGAETAPETSPPEGGPPASGSTATPDPDSSSPTAAPAETVEPPASSAEVLEVVAHLRGLDGWTVIPLAHFRRGRRHVLVVWPAINATGRLVDATVVGVPLEQGDDGALNEAGSRWVIREEAPSRASLSEALGGEDWQVADRGTGLALEQLGPSLGRLAADFGRAVARGGREAALDAAVAFSRLLPIERAAFEPSVARLLWMASAHSATLEHQGTERRGDRAQLTLRVVRGALPIRTITAVAAPVVGETDLWVVESYQE